MVAAIFYTKVRPKGILFLRKIMASVRLKAEIRRPAQEGLGLDIMNELSSHKRWFPAAAPAFCGLWLLLAPGCGPVATLKVQATLPAARDYYRFVRVFANSGRYGSPLATFRLAVAVRRVSFQVKLRERQSLDYLELFFDLCATPACNAPMDRRPPSARTRVLEPFCRGKTTTVAIPLTELNTQGGLDAPAQVPAGPRCSP